MFMKTKFWNYLSKTQSYSHHNLHLGLKKCKNLVLYPKLINIVDV